jgi:hypothetical protein
MMRGAKTGRSHCDEAISGQTKLVNQHRREHDLKQTHRNLRNVNRFPRRLRDDNTHANEHDHFDAHRNGSTYIDANSTSDGNPYAH